MENIIVENRASATLPIAVSATDTSITLASLSAGMTNALNAVNSTVASPLVCVLTLSGESGAEEIKVTAWDGVNGVATITRDVSGSGALAFISGDDAEIRLTAVHGRYDNRVVEPDGSAVYGGMVAYTGTNMAPGDMNGLNALAIGPNVTVNEREQILIGDGIKGCDVGMIHIGRDNNLNSSYGDDGWNAPPVLIGSGNNINYNTSYHNALFTCIGSHNAIGDTQGSSTIVGQYSYTYTPAGSGGEYGGQVAIGYYAQSKGAYGIAVGYLVDANRGDSDSQGGVSFGSEAYGDGGSTVVIGRSVNGGENSIIIGRDSSTPRTTSGGVPGDLTISLGRNNTVNSENGATIGFNNTVSASGAFLFGANGAANQANSFQFSHRAESGTQSPAWVQTYHANAITIGATENIAPELVVPAPSGSNITVATIEFNIQAVGGTFGSPIMVTEKVTAGVIYNGTSQSIIGQTSTRMVETALSDETNISFLVVDGVSAGQVALQVVDGRTNTPSAQLNVTAHGTLYQHETTF